MLAPIYLIQTLTTYNCKIGVNARNSLEIFFMRPICLLAFIIFIASCNNTSDNIPDVSRVKADFKLERFDRDFFAMDSNNTRQGLKDLQHKYPDFSLLFVGNILGLGPITESNPVVFDGTKSFLNISKRVYDTAQQVFRNTDDLERELKQSLKFVKYYFPKYKVPEKIITMVGPMDALPSLTTNEKTPNILGVDFLAIGLQFYLGKDYSIYNDLGFISNIAPQYRSRRFSKEYIASDAMKVIVDDLYPDNSAGKALIVQMIEHGKRWWLLDKLMPATMDTLKTGFTGYQMSGCYANEAAIWKHFREETDLFTIEPEMIKNYIGESPFCLPISQEAPGNIGPWVGKRIVEAYAEKNPKLTIDEIMKTDARKLLDESKYKPK